MKKAFITGIGGQDGSYLAELLLEKGYEVYGFVRRTSTFNRHRIDHLKGGPNYRLIYGDLSDSSSINSALRNIMPDEVYNLAAQSHVGISFEIPEYTGDVNAIGVTRLLDAVRKIEDESGHRIKVYQASTSEMFGKVREMPQKETTPFYPRSPYGCSKVYAFWICVNYRESYDMFICNGILFNHESPRRGENFVTRKITREIAKIKEGVSTSFSLGNLDARRDWGHAKDYVEAMHLMLQHDAPDDYVVATGETRSVREFLEIAFEAAGIPVESNGKEGIDEEYVRKDTGEPVLTINERYYRPAEVDVLLGDSAKARSVLGWEPKISFSELVRDMLDSDMKELKEKLYGNRV
jgi:GDPmannose 4,6-dehydratase